MALRGDLIIARAMLVERIMQSNLDLATAFL
jgi:hypothetical protein